VPYVELLQPGQGSVDHDVALSSSLERAASADIDDVADHRPCLVAHRVEGDMGSVEGALFLGYLALLWHAPPSSSPRRERTSLAGGGGALFSPRAKRVL